MAKIRKVKKKQIRGLLTQRPEQPNLRHGVFPFIKSGVHPCNKCIKKEVCPRFQEDSDCAFLAEYQDQVEYAVMDIDIISEADRPVAQMLAKQLAVLALCEMYFAKEGMVIHENQRVEAQPLLNSYNTFMRSAMQTMQGLGLGPSARSKINMDRMTTVRMMRELGVNDGEQKPKQVENEGYGFLDE
ncbi:hypothetical protein EEL32_00245 (plasmid) [Brevibacillus laterosporus]|uniref:Uncharacterized protein n=1 Tax=Brevibacillus laterosporus TaxID=1465 RepID=A0A502J316_BRELA|nr:P27 family phage terminase small subunit [Brevibacillus laterosporus]QDX91078.1 hypothetical protein EEL30_00945 [Brevibacillus laterosporus]TPG93521.1 hypothetical protein EEL32_00245 [Brevibacillus laterosporus]